jgi:hypothetical protein
MMRNDESQLQWLQRCVDVGETYLLRQLEVVERLQQQGAPSGLAIQLMRAFEMALRDDYLALSDLTDPEPAAVLPVA